MNDIEKSMIEDVVKKLKEVGYILDNYNSKTISNRLILNAGLVNVGIKAECVNGYCKYFMLTVPTNKNASIIETEVYPDLTLEVVIDLLRGYFSISQLQEDLGDLEYLYWRK